MNLIPKDFNYLQYIILNNDLKYFNEEEAISHYINYGINENREYKFNNLPEDFNYEEYIILNSDLKHFTELEAIKHYINYGIDEKRKYKLIEPIDFDFDEYKIIHKEIKDFSNNDIILHFYSFRRNYKLNQNFVNIVDINKIDTSRFLKKVYVIENIRLGGTEKYMNDLINTYKFCLFIFIETQENLLSVNFESTDVLFCNQLINTDIKIDDLLIINKKCRLILVIHDMYWLSDDSSQIQIHGSYLKEKIYKESIKPLFKEANLVIFPSIFCYTCYIKWLSITNSIILNHIDYEINNKVLFTKINDLSINIGFFVDMSNCKGKELLETLIKKRVEYKRYKINYKIVGVNIDRYKDDKFDEHVKINKINGFLLLNKFGETYCYALTKHLNTGLPIFYNNLGSFKERVKKREGYLACYQNENEYQIDFDRDILLSKFDCFLDSIILNQSEQEYSYEPQKIVIEDEYNLIFG